MTNTGNQMKLASAIAEICVDAMNDDSLTTCEIIGTLELTKMAIVGAKKDNAKKASGIGMGDPGPH